MAAAAGCQPLRHLPNQQLLQQQKAVEQTASELRGGTSCSAAQCECANWQLGELRTWRADAEKARRWAWAKAFLAANMMNVMGINEDETWLDNAGG